MIPPTRRRMRVLLAGIARRSDLGHMPTGEHLVDCAGSATSRRWAVVNLRELRRLGLIAGVATRGGERIIATPAGYDEIESWTRPEARQHDTVRP